MIDALSSGATTCFEGRTYLTTHLGPGGQSVEDGNAWFHRFQPQVARPGNLSSISGHRLGDSDRGRAVGDARRRPDGPVCIKPVPPHGRSYPSPVAAMRTIHVNSVPLPRPTCPERRPRLRGLAHSASLRGSQSTFLVSTGSAPVPTSVLRCHHSRPPARRADGALGSSISRDR